MIPSFFSFFIFPSITNEFLRKDIEPTPITNTNYMLIVITVDYVRKEIKFVILDLTKVFSDVFYKSLFRHNFWILFFITVYRYSGCVTAVHFILFYFANYSPSIAMELKVGKEIACK